MTERLDLALVGRRLARSRQQAADLVAAGVVRINGRPAAKLSQPVGPNDDITVPTADHYVSRAAHKLLGALDDSDTKIPSRALDAGASTGGFTQVLLERGCQQVYAVDVGHGQLAPQLRADHRVTVWERTNLRELTLPHVEGQPVDLVVADVSFISLELLMDPLFAVLAPAGTALLLVKPQFEVGRGGLDSRGVVRFESGRLAALQRVRDACQTRGWYARWQGESRLPGPAGNVEYFLKLTRGSESAGAEH
ncbi:MAG: TlyA family RNA methyltransferase [Micropruina sp.]|nr:TlyA family RNA methyltransferase [Micropruina sp.]